MGLYVLFSVLLLVVFFAPQFFSLAVVKVPFYII